MIISDQFVILQNLFFKPVSWLGLLCLFLLKNIFFLLYHSIDKKKNLKVLFWYQMEAAQCLFSYYSFPFFLFAWTDSGRQNSICRGQQLNLYIPISTLKTQINLASFSFLGRLEVLTFFAIFRVFFHIFDGQNSFCTYLCMFPLKVD